MVAFAAAIIGIAAANEQPTASTRHSATTRSAKQATTTSAGAATSAGITTTTVDTRRHARFTIAFGGDVHFEGVIRPQLNRRAPAMLGAIAPSLRSADIAMVNLETAITDRGTRAAKEFNFRAPGRAFVALASAGVDVVTMANNHGMDFGQVGLQDSLAAARNARFPVIGIGRDESSAYAAYRTTVRGERISILAATDVIDGALIDPWTATPTQGGLASAKRQDRFIAAVRAERARADTVVVYLHWGIELHACPTNRQRELARALTAAGADIVVGSHAHVLLGAGRLGNAYVDYGLGNFVFYANGGVTTQSGVLTLTVSGRHVHHSRWTPARIVQGLPQPLTGAAAEGAKSNWLALRTCTGLTA